MQAAELGKYLIFPSPTLSPLPEATLLLSALSVSVKPPTLQHMSAHNSDENLESNQSTASFTFYVQHAPLYYPS
jgi:hypothetical protein